MRYIVCALVAGLVVFSSAGSGYAQSCGRDASGFGGWLRQYRALVAGQGISPATLAAALDGVGYDAKVIRLDRSQRSFKLSFEQFYARRVSQSLISRGRRLMATHRATLNRVEQTFGVPAEVLIAIWGLETNYGADRGLNMSIFRALATLAYDCRRAAFFRNELTSALMIVERGDMPASQMRGGWAGEIGQTQFLPSSYVKYAVDFDGNGKRDLIRSVPDLLASTANFLKGHGWVAKQGWQPGTQNYAVLADWNRAQVYQRTIAVMADKLSR